MNAAVEAARGRNLAEQPKRWEQYRLFIPGLRRNLLDHNRRRSAARVRLAAGRDSLPGKRQQLFILTRGWRGVGDRPVDRPVVGEDHQRRPSLCASLGTLRADRLLQTLGKRT